MVFFLHNLDCFQGFKVAVPHVILVVSTVIYTVFGGILFYFVERPNEERTKLKSRDSMLKTQVRLLRLIRRENSIIKAGTMISTQSRKATYRTFLG